MIEGVSIHEFARMMGVSRPAVRRWLRCGYFSLLPDGTLDAAAAEAALAAWGLPRARYQAAGGEIRMTLAQALAWPFTAEAEAAVAEVVDDLLRPIDD